MYGLIPCFTQIITKQLIKNDSELKQFNEFLLRGITRFIETVEYGGEEK